MLDLAKGEGVVKVHVLGDNVWEQTAVMHCMQKSSKFLQPIDVSVNEDVRWHVLNGNCYLLIIFTIFPAEVKIPQNNMASPSIKLSERSKRYISETNEMCRQIQKKSKGHVNRLIVVPDGRLTHYPLALLAEQWHDDGLGEYTYMFKCMHAECM